MSNINFDRIELANLLFGEKKILPEDLEKRYPPRRLPEGAIVTRVGPSPTGFMHIGTIYAALIPERAAHQTGGVFFLRIEDTDKSREVAGARQLIVRSLTNYGIIFDEGETISGGKR
jgi:glutamyl-tRNA synthetase